MPILSIILKIIAYSYMRIEQNLALQFKKCILIINNKFPIISQQMQPQYPQMSAPVISSSSQKIQLYLSARNLLDKDFFSKSDPYIKVFYKPIMPLAPGQKHTQFYIGKTQTINNNLNPNFTTCFKLEYVFEMQQELRFEIYDYDDGKNDDYLGTAHCMLGAVAGAKSQTLILDIKYQSKDNQDGKQKSSGKLIVRLQTLKQTNIFLQMKWSGVKLLNTDSYFDWWDKSDPYLKLIKIRSDNSYIEVMRTQVINNNLNPSWKGIEVSMEKLVNQGLGKWKVQCWDWEEEGDEKHQFIGQAFIQLEDVRKSKLPKQIILLNRKHKNPGKLLLQKFAEVSKPGFMDYLKGGLELNLSIAIDFTGSNGIPTHPNSLHYVMNPMQPNQYQQAILAVSRILLNYDTDKRIPCFAFGGKPHFPSMNSSNVNHCFPLSGDPQKIQAFGIQHLMELYSRALNSIQLAGPTYFSAIIEQVIKTARMNASQGSNTYQILLILTDGQIHDMQKTVDLLVQNCNLPLSLIIVGIGNADFTNMSTLDGDTGLYGSNGKKALRDIVQFVPFRNVGMNPDMLARQLLAQLPDQVVQYMRLINKMPSPPVQVNIDKMIGSNKISPQQAMQAQVAGIFQKANFFQGF